MVTGQNLLENFHQFAFIHAFLCKKAAKMPAIVLHPSQADHKNKGIARGKTGRFDVQEKSAVADLYI